MFLYIKLALIILLSLTIVFAGKIGSRLSNSSSDTLMLNIFKIILGIFVLLLLLDVTGIVDVLPE